MSQTSAGPPLSPRLRHGASVVHAIEVLRNLQHKGRNAIAGGGLPMPRWRDSYLMWCEEAESQLRSLFTDAQAADRLLSERYWHLRAMQEDAPRPFAVVSQEVDVQVAALEALEQRLRIQHAAFSVPPETCVAIPDTNILLHYSRLDQIDWPPLVGSKQVRLVLPLIVIDELDVKSYASHGRVADRAKAVLRSLQRLRANAAPEQPVSIRGQTELQIFVDPPGHVRSSNSDGELLDRAEHLHALTGGHVLVATADYGMQLRAQSRGLRWLRPPDNLRLDRDGI